MSNIRERNENLMRIIKQMQEEAKYHKVCEYTLKNIGINANPRGVGMAFEQPSTLIDFHYYLNKQGVQHECNVEYLGKRLCINIRIKDVVFYCVKYIIFKQYKI